MYPTLPTPKAKGRIGRRQQHGPLLLSKMAKEHTEGFQELPTALPQIESFERDIYSAFSRRPHEYCSTVGPSARLANWQIHEDVLGNDAVSNVLGQLKPAPSVADGDSHGFFRRLLAYHVFIQFVDDLLGG